MGNAQSQPFGLQRRALTPTDVTPLDGVRQDKPRTLPARVASMEPAPETKRVRAQPLKTNPARSQTASIPKTRTVHLTIWVKPVVKEELQRMAKREEISVSATAGALLEHALQANIDMQYGALLKPAIRESIHDEMAAFARRFAFLLIRTGFASEQTRILAATILGRMPDTPTMTPELLNTLLDQSRTAAKRKLSYKDPSLETIITELEQALEGGAAS